MVIFKQITAKSKTPERHCHQSKPERVNGRKPNEVMDDGAGFGQVEGP